LSFRLAIDLGQAAYLPNRMPENFETLDWGCRLLLPTLGGLLVGLLLHVSRPDRRLVGVVHVMERLAYHQGRLPLANAIQQFLGAAICLVSGNSVGREGPGVHLGAAAGSLVGQALELPNNSIRTLVACGTAAAIAASFNTPIAGVIFAMEVVMMEYTIAGFTPVILAAVTGAVLTNLVYGARPAFSVPPLHMESVLELFYVVFIGVLIGSLAAAFVRILRASTKLWPQGVIWQKTTIAGAFTGLCALLAPGVMGTGYDSVDAALSGTLPVTVMVTLVVLKLLTTTVGLGLGLPGGLIGPTLVIGAAAGGALGVLGQLLAPAGAASHSYYALLGMGAMMSATLQAPLAALMAMLELTGNPNIILPGMLATVTANLVAREVFRQDSVFLTLLRARGLDYRNDPLAQSLRRLGVASVMNRNVTLQPPLLARDLAVQVLNAKPDWILITEARRPLALLPAADLARALADQPQATLNLMEIPAARRDVAPVAFQATLQEALDAMNKHRIDALFVERTTAPPTKRIYGVVTRDLIERTYQYRGD
jgi:H+/Cl- antiporter ClcA